MKYSINVTVHDKDFLIERVLDSIRKYTVGEYEIVVVLDGCKDKSEEKVFSFFKNNNKINHKILYADDVFETKANNIAARNSIGDYIIIVQDDVIVNEPGWNGRLSKPIVSISDVFAVTARTAYNYRVNPGSNHILLGEKEDCLIDNCWSDILYHENVAEKSRGLPRNTFAIRSCVNRGPLLIDHKTLESVNYLDENFSPLDQDDADLCYRVFKKLGKVAGCYQTEFISELEWGGTRPDGKSPASWHLKSHHKNTRNLYNNHLDLLQNCRVDRNIEL